MPINKYYNIFVLIQFDVGDQVIVLDDEERVSKLQDGYGGWNKAMAQVHVRLYCMIKYKNFLT